MKTAKDLIIEELMEKYDDVVFSLDLPISNLSGALEDLIVHLPADFEGKLYIKRMIQSIKELNDIVKDN